MPWLFTTQTVVYIAAFLLLAVIGLAFWVARLETRLKRLTRGKKGFDFEDSVNDINQELSKIGQYRKHLDEYLADVERRLRRSVKGVGTVRFNPFPDKGGNQSFASAFVDEEGNGVVISTLCAREKTSVYAKPLRGHQSQHELTEEEKRAIELSRKHP